MLIMTLSLITSILSFFYAFVQHDRHVAGVFFNKFGNDGIALQAKAADYGFLSFLMEFSEMLAEHVGTDFDIVDAAVSENLRERCMFCYLLLKVWS